MNGKKGLRDYALTFGGAGTQYVNVRGDYYHLLTATGTITFVFDDSAPIQRIQGHHGEFDYSRVQVSSPIAQTIRVALGYGRLVNNATATIAGPVSAVWEPANQNIPLAEVVIGIGLTVLLSAADANRKSLRVGVKAAEANGVYVGSIATGAGAEGGYIEEGCVDYIESEAAIYGYNPGAVAITVNVLNLRRV